MKNCNTCLHFGLMKPKGENFCAITLNTIYNKFTQKCNRYNNKIKIYKRIK